MRNTKPILVAEDDEIDSETIQRAFKEIKVTNHLQLTSNGEEALSFLQDDQAQKPCVILLDLNMPRMNGFEFLKAVKQDRQLKLIPVVVLTTSREERDKIEAFNLGVAGYMVKSLDYFQFVEIAKTIDRYWTLSELPE